MRTLFPLGRIVATRGAMGVAPKVLRAALQRHAAGDWGVVCAADKAANEAALRDGERVLSAWPIDAGEACLGWGDNTLWIITEWDRSCTTALLPDEY